jgi:hypothetical protein
MTAKWGFSAHKRDAMEYGERSQTQIEVFKPDKKPRGLRPRGASIEKLSMAL